jgi:hypothetical protein
MHSNSDDILDSALNIQSISEDTGRRYFKLQISFSEEDVMTVYRDSVEEILTDLPQVLISAIRARIIHEKLN